MSVLSRLRHRSPASVRSAQLAGPWAEHSEHLPEDESALESAASGTCSGGGMGMPPSEPLSRTLLTWVGEGLLLLCLGGLCWGLLLFGHAVQSEGLSSDPTSRAVLTREFWVEIGARR